MESVPETKSVKEIGISTIPSLRLKDSSFSLHHEFESNLIRPPSEGYSTSPTLSLVSSPLSPSSNSFLPRNTPPFARGHSRSKSSVSCLAPPPILRTQSMPGFNSSSLILDPPIPSSPRGSPSRARSSRKPVDEVYISLPSRNLPGFNANTPSFSEKNETTLKTFDKTTLPPSPNCPPSIRLCRSSSPRFISSQHSTHVTVSPINPSTTSSPTINSPRYVDSNLGPSYCYSGSLSYPGSLSCYSVPSPPTSSRSRSPSISSLETIPDSPDAEEEALEADRLAQLRKAADVVDSGSEPRPKTVQDSNGGRARSSGAGFNWDKRKRWSVCGAERRGDLNLDTIWED